MAHLPHHTGRGTGPGGDNTTDQPHTPLVGGEKPPFLAAFSPIDTLPIRAIIKYVQSSINTTKREAIDGTGKEERQ
jgi:hypothetical protein